MGLADAMGVGRIRLLRSHSPAETAAFWIVLTLSYLALSFLAGTRGVGYTERVDWVNRSIAFDLNPFLWFPDVFLHADPSTNPTPFILWWIFLAVATAEGVMVVVRVLRRGPPAGATNAPGQKSRSA